jgi:hypothetical protein
MIGLVSKVVVTFRPQPPGHIRTLISHSFHSFQHTQTHKHTNKQTNKQTITLLHFSL